MGGGAGVVTPGRIWVASGVLGGLAAVIAAAAATDSRAGALEVVLAFAVSALVASIGMSALSRRRWPPSAWRLEHSWRAVAAAFAWWVAVELAVPTPRTMPWEAAVGLVSLSSALLLAEGVDRLVDRGR